MSARDDIARHFNPDSPIHPLLDAYRAEILAEAKREVIVWLVKKAREGTPVTVLASKVDRGAIRLFLDAERAREKATASAATATPTEPTIRIPNQRYTVLVGLAAGETAKDTARRMFVDECTVKTHRRKLYAQLGVTNGSQAVAVAVTRGLITIAVPPTSRKDGV